MAIRTTAQLSGLTNVIRNETRRGFNTKVRVANLFQDIIDSKVQVQTFTGTTAGLLSITAFDFYTQNIQKNLYTSLSGFTAHVNNFNTFTGSTLSSVTLQKEVTGSTYIVQMADRNYAIYFTFTGETLVLLKDLTTNFEFTGIRKEGAGVVRFSGTTTGSSITLRTIDNLLTIGREKGAVSWIQKTADEWYGFGAVGSGGTASSTGLVTQAKMNAYSGGTTGSAAPATYATKVSVNAYTGTTAPATFANKAFVNTYTGGTTGSAAPATYVRKTLFNTYTGATQTELDSLHEDVDNISLVLINGAATLDNTAFGKLHVCSGTATDYTVTLPTAVGITGKTLVFKGAPGLTKVVTLDGNGSQTIDGRLDRKFASGGLLVLISDGSNWIVVNEVPSWVPYSPSFVGLSVNPSGVGSVKYSLQGKQCHVVMFLPTNGTSNGTTFTMTLPFSAATSQISTVPTVVNNGLIPTNPGVAYTTAGTNILGIYRDATTSLAWTSTGQKNAFINFTYEVV